MCFQRSFVWMHGRSLAGVSFTCASHCAEVIALALDAALSPTSATTQSSTAHNRCFMLPPLGLEASLRPPVGKDNDQGLAASGGTSRYCRSNEAIWANAGAATTP